MDAATEQKLMNSIEDIGHDVDAMRYGEENGSMNNGWDSFLAGMNANNGRYGDQMAWNNPMFYLIFLALFGRNGFGYNGGCGGLGMTEAMQSLGEIKSGLASGALERTRIADQIAQTGTQLGFSKDFIYSAVMNNSEKICCAVNTLQAQMSNGNHDILMQLCGLGSNIQQGLAGLALSNERQTNEIGKGLAALGYAQEKNASDLRFQIAKEGAETRQASHADRDAIIGWLTQDKIQSLQEKLTAASLEISQRNQTDALKEAIYNIRNGGNIYGQPVSALNPNGSQSYPYWVNNTVQS